MQLVVCIHLNPPRAGIVKEVEALRVFPYVGHSALMGKTFRTWQDAEYVPTLFEKTLPEPRRNLEKDVSK